MPEDGTQDGFGKYLGFTIEHADGDAVRGSISISPEHLQGHGIVHGGVYCSVVEHAASVGASLWHGDRGRVVGLSNSTHFIRGVGSGLLSVEATPLQRGRTQQLWQVFITDDQQRLVAKGEVRLANIADRRNLG